MLVWLNWLVWSVGFTVVVLVGLVVCVMAAFYPTARTIYALAYSIQEQRFGIVEPTTIPRRTWIFLACFAYAWWHAYSPSIRWRNMTRRSDYERYQLTKQKDE